MRMSEEMLDDARASVHSIRQDTLKNMVLNLIQCSLQAHRFNVTATAATLNLSRQSIYNYLHQAHKGK